MESPESEGFVMEIDEIDLLHPSREGRVEPFEIIQGKVFLPEWIVDEDTVPLATL